MSAGLVGDLAGAHRVVDSQERFAGRVWDVVTDTVELPGGERVVRDVVLHPSAVAVLALADDERVLVVHQYRHPVRATLWELPAGLLDVSGEDPLEAARRELWEETHHEADEWGVLVDYLSSPGFCDEALRVYLARGVRRSEGEPHDRHGEERDMPVEWVALDDLRDGVLGGALHNPTLALGVLAAVAARGVGWSSLRAADAAWPFGPRSLRD
ncbi:MAG: NUDIX domain-containing protein [Actinomycetes bacterium]